MAVTNFPDIDGNMSLVAVVGQRASGEADAGRPGKVGGVYNSTVPTLLTGTRGDAQRRSGGLVSVQLMTANAATAIGSDATNGLDVDVTRLSALVAGSAQIGSTPLGASATVGTGTVNARVVTGASNNLTSVKAT